MFDKPVDDMAATPGSGGYWLVASDSGLFSSGDVCLFGSAGGTPLNQPVVSKADTPDEAGSGFVASDGGVFTFDNAGFFASAVATP